MTIRVDIGDVLVVATGNSFTAKLIRVGEVLRGQASNDNHVAVVHHQTDGVWWAVEGRPGGVGWVDARRYLADPRTVTNADQPKTSGQRNHIADSAVAMLGTPYDWNAIVGDAFESLHIRYLFLTNWRGKGSPGHVVCSSLAAWLYKDAGLAHPRLEQQPGHLPIEERYAFPSDWADFCINRAWTKETV